MVRSIVIGAQHAGQRLDQALAGELGLSRAQVQRLVSSGAVLHNGRRAHKGATLVEGDQLSLDETLLDVSVVPQPELPLMIRYQDDALVLLDKPAGMPSHPLEAGERDCLANALVARFPEMARLGYDPRQAGLVNRLDNDTSGLVLAARTAEAFRELRGLLKEGGIEKRYLALTSGEVPLGEITRWLAPRGPRVAVVKEGESEGRETHSRVLTCTPLRQGRYLVEVAASHAYRHQVRVHLAELGAPIVGDALYGGAVGAHHFLHASRVSFAHPFTGVPLDIASPLPDEWANA
jgi:23S rRNA pseudouridine1911/1915/1917 synthase